MSNIKILMGSNPTKEPNYDYYSYHNYEVGDITHRLICVPGSYFLTELDSDGSHRIIEWRWSIYRQGIFDGNLTLKPCYCYKHRNHLTWNEGCDTITKYYQEYMLPIISDNVQVYLPRVLCNIVLSYSSLMLLRANSSEELF